MESRKAGLTGNKSKAARHEIVLGGGFGPFSYLRSNQPLWTPQGHFAWRDNRTVPLPAKSNFDGREFQCVYAYYNFITRKAKVEYLDREGGRFRGDFGHYFFFGIKANACKLGDFFQNLSGNNLI